MCTPTRRSCNTMLWILLTISSVATSLGRPSCWAWFVLVRLQWNSLEFLYCNSFLDFLCTLINCLARRHPTFMNQCLWNERSAQAGSSLLTSTCEWSPWTPLLTLTLCLWKVSEEPISSSVITRFNRSRLISTCSDEWAATFSRASCETFPCEIFGGDHLWTNFSHAQIFRYCYRTVSPLMLTFSGIIFTESLKSDRPVSRTPAISTVREVNGRPTAVFVFNISSAFKKTSYGNDKTWALDITSTPKAFRSLPCVVAITRNSTQNEMAQRRAVFRDSVSVKRQNNVFAYTAQLGTERSRRCDRLDWNRPNDQSRGWGVYASCVEKKTKTISHINLLSHRKYTY